MVLGSNLVTPVHPVHICARSENLKTAVLQVTAFFLDAHEREVQIKKGVQPPKLLGCEMVAVCCAATWALLYKQRRKVNDFQRRRASMKGLSYPHFLRKNQVPTRIECDVNLLSSSLIVIP